MPLARSALMTGGHNKVAGNGGLAAARRLKPNPGSDPQGTGRGERRAIFSHGVPPRHAKLVDTTIGLAFDANDAVELGGVQIDRGWGSSRCRCRQWRVALG